MSVRRLLGWEPGEFTTFEYDEDGRLVSTVTVREPEFSDLDRAWMLRSWENDHAPRGSHGVLMSEATDRKNMGAFKLSEPVTDYAQKALIEGRDLLKKKYGEDMLSYLSFHVEMKDPPTRQSAASTATES